MTRPAATPTSTPTLGWPPIVPPIAPAMMLIASSDPPERASVLGFSSTPRFMAAHRRGSKREAQRKFW